MTRKFKALGLALLAALTLIAAMASAAKAQFEYFTSASAHTLIKGAQEAGGVHKFTAGPGVGAISCEVADLIGTQVGYVVAELKFTPTYGPTCKDSYGRVVHVITNTLQYDFLYDTQKGRMWITGNLELTVTASKPCVIKVVHNQLVNGLTYTNLLGGTVTVTFNLTGITSLISGGFFACGTAATHSSTGTYTGTTLLQATTTEGEPVSILAD